MTAPELEAVGWYVRTKRTDSDAAGWLVADCSSSPHGAEYARQFAASGDLLEALQMVLADCVVSSAVRAVAEVAIKKALGN